MKLKLDWCTHKAAKMACEKWHYSKTIPVVKNLMVGAWEDDRFIGVVLYSMGSGNACSGKMYGLEPMQMVELQRVAFQDHETEITRIIALSMKFLRKACPKIRLVVSFADPSKGHHGGIYQGGNWVYAGETGIGTEVELTDGRWVHSRTVNAHWGELCKAHFLKTGRTRKMPGKHRYLYPLDDAMKERIRPLARPYPKRAGSADSGTTGIQPVGGGAVPTPALITHA